MCFVALCKIILKREFLSVDLGSLTGIVDQLLGIVSDKSLSVTVELGVLLSGDDTIAVVRIGVRRGDGDKSTGSLDICDGQSKALFGVNSVIRIRRLENGHKSVLGPLKGQGYHGSPVLCGKIGADRNRNSSRHAAVHDSPILIGDSGHSLAGPASCH